MGYEQRRRESGMFKVGEKLLTRDQLTAAVANALSAFLNRGFVARFKWLLFGK